MNKWQLTEHVCRECFGRVLERSERGRMHYRCADCGHSGAGTVDSVCSCGATLKSGERIGLRCIQAPAGSPTEFVAEYTGEPV
jgi:ribosomal protein L37AE/L43A